MKKLSIFLLGALAIAATSCEEEIEFDAPVQTNPQGPVFEAEGVTVAQPSETSISLKESADASVNVAVANFATQDFPAGYDLKVVTYISKDNTFSMSRAVATKVVDNVAYITPQDFQDAYVASISKSPSAKDVFVRFAAYAVNATSEYRIGGEDSYLGGYSLNITPFPAEIVIEQNYYLLGTINGWSVADAIKMNHSGGNPYDDPIFTTVVEITPEQADEGWWWKIIPESTFNTGDWVSAPNSSYGPEEDGAEDPEGMLVPSKMVDGEYVDAGAGMLTQYGTYLLTINMLEGTYSFQLAVPQLYVMGDAAGWDWNSPLVTELRTTDYTNYYGFAKCTTGGYKFTSEKDWSAAFNLGAAGVPEPSGIWTLAGALGNNSQDNIVPAETGLYWHYVNLPALEFGSYYISTLGLIGDATPNGWDASTALTPSDDCLVWEGDIEFAATGEFKIRANDAWDVSLGGDVNNLDWNNGANIPTPGAGVKHVVVDLSSHPYTVTIK